MYVNSSYKALSSGIIIWLAQALAVGKVDCGQNLNNGLE